MWTEPDAICASIKYPELKWVSGLFYWMREVQSGDFGTWNYQNEISKLSADPNNANLRRQFINAVSGIVNRGGPFAPNVDGGAERASNFEKAWAIFGPTALSIEEGGNGLVVIPPPFEESANTQNVGAIAGGVVSGIAFFGVAVAAAVVMIRRQRSSSTPRASQLSSSNPMFNKL